VSQDCLHASKASCHLFKFILLDSLLVSLSNINGQLSPLKPFLNSSLVSHVMEIWVENLLFNSEGFQDFGHLYKGGVSLAKILLLDAFVCSHLFDFDEVFVLFLILLYCRFHVVECHLHFSGNMSKSNCSPTRHNFSLSTFKNEIEIISADLFSIAIKLSLSCNHSDSLEHLSS